MKNFTIILKNLIIYMKLVSKAIDFFCEQVKKDLLPVKVETVTHIKASQLLNT